MVDTLVFATLLTQVFADTLRLLRRLRAVNVEMWKVGTRDGWACR